MKKIIEVLEVTKTFGKVEALSSVSFHISKGEVFCILGPNGAGKTTAINLLLGILKPDSGNIYVQGKPIPKKRREILRDIGYLPQTRALYEFLTARENIEFFAASKGSPRSSYKKNIEQLIALLDLNEFVNRQVAKLSGGTQQRVALAAAIAHQPKILFLDEPTVGLDPVMRKSLWLQFRDWAERQGVTVIATTHYIQEAAYADTILVLHEGKMIATGSPDDLREKTGEIEMENVFLELIQTSGGSVE